MHRSSPRPTQYTAVRVTAAVATIVKDEDFYLCVPTDWLGTGDLDHRKEKALKNVVKVQMKDRICGYLQSVRVEIKGSEIGKQLKRILECFGYYMTMSRSSYIYGRGHDINGRNSW